MKNIQNLFLITFLVGVQLHVFAQDKMYLRNQREPLQVKVLEIGVEDIKYKLWPVSENDITHVVLKDLVMRIVTEKGDVFEFKTKTEELNDPKTYADAPKNILKIRLLSPLTGAASFYYERSLSNTKSFEGGIAIIGLGSDINSDNQRGVVLRGGYKFMRSPSYYTRYMGPPTLMNGPYFKPEIAFAQYAVDRFAVVTTTSNGMTMSILSKQRISVTALAALFNFGYQWVISNSFVIDYSLGAGYGFSQTSLPTNDIFLEMQNLNHYGFWGASRSSSLTLTAAFKLGYLF